MAEYKLFESDVPFVSTAEFHADRERAPHLEQAFHRERMLLAAEFVRMAVRDLGNTGDLTVSDLGCGDGGLLSLVQNEAGIGEAWGYDFCPANEAGWEERAVQATALDVFGKDTGIVGIGDIVVMTEVLEHLHKPHWALRWARQEGKRLVCSSPWNERPGAHSAEHAWAWDLEGYAAMIEAAGWTITRHEQAGLFQVVLAK